VICNSAKQGLIPQRDYFDKDIANSDNTDGYYIIETNDFVYNPRKSTDAPYGPISSYKYPEAGIVSPLYLCFRAKQEINPLYFEWYFRSSAWHRYIYMSGDSGARHDRVSIKDDTFFAMPINIPSAQEQNRIALFLNIIEQRIDKQRSLVEALKKYKRGLVKALISGTVAFVGSEHKRWETVSLAEIFTISAGGDIDRQNSSPSYSTSYPYPVYANALTNNGLYGYANYFKVEGDSITVSGRGEVGHAIARHCKYVPIVRLLSLVPKYEDDVDFFAYMINATSIYIESTGVPQLTSPQLGAVKVLRPPILEQKRLSSLLLKIDAKLDNEERLTFYLEKIRASMLQQLFI
jgi:type I restriction enzyme, S subunit